MSASALFQQRLIILMIDLANPSSGPLTTLRSQSVHSAAIKERPSGHSAPASLLDNQTAL
jgi:hypothetical protein